MSLKPVLIMAGGTGGHVYPALAVAEYMRDQGVTLFWLGTRAGLEARVVPQNNIKLFTIYISGLRGKKISRWVIAPFTIIIAFIQSIRIILNIKPSAVIGMGGFVSGPGGIAAWLLRIPLYIHEQNSIAGLTNRLLSPFAKTIMQGFPGALHGEKVITTGNPVRKDILESSNLPDQSINDSVKRPLRLLVLGGSLGAKVLNELLPKIMVGLSGDFSVELWHQTGRDHFDTTIAQYKEYKINGYKVVPYIENMAEAYSWADIVLCRAGALTISEISIMGIASILVPYPYAADDHQTTNARYLSDKGGTIIVPQSELNEVKIVELLTRFNSERNLLVEMASSVRKLSFQNATRDIGNICMGTVHV